MDNPNEHGATTSVGLTATTTPATISVIDQRAAGRPGSRETRADDDSALAYAPTATACSTNDVALAVPRSARIATVDNLREHLQWAIELEHATLPVYLCALYSLDAARNPSATEVLGSVFVEEMLHLTLAANLLNAVGGRPRLDTPSMLPGYPRTLPHGQRSFEMSLLPFGPEAVEQLLTIELPAPAGAPAQGDEYETIGQFYDAVGRGLRDLCYDLGEAHVFSGDPARQVADTFCYGGSGRVITIDSLATATAAPRRDRRTRRRGPSRRVGRRSRHVPP